MTKTKKTVLGKLPTSKLCCLVNPYNLKGSMCRDCMVQLFKDLGPGQNALLDKKNDKERISRTKKTR